MLPSGCIVCALYHKLYTQSSAPEDGRNYLPKHVELIGIVNKLLLLHLVGCLHYSYLRFIWLLNLFKASKRILQMRMKSLGIWNSFSDSVARNLEDDFHFILNNRKRLRLQDGQSELDHRRQFLPLERLSNGDVRESSKNGPMYSVDRRSVLQFDTAFVNSRAAVFRFRLLHVQRQLRKCANSSEIFFLSFVSTSLLYLHFTVSQCCFEGKGKVHPCTGTEGVYRPYGP